MGGGGDPYNHTHFGIFLKHGPWGERGREDSYTGTHVAQSVGWGALRVHTQLSNNHGQMQQSHNALVQIPFKEDMYRKGVANVSTEWCLPFSGVSIRAAWVLLVDG